MADETLAICALTRAGIAFTVHRYVYDPSADSTGLAAAEALREAPARVLKTLMVLIDGRPACVILAADRHLAMKRLAVAAGAKSADMMKPADTERSTGSKVGGTSPLGQRRSIPIVIDAAAAMEPFVIVNGGGCGLQLML